MHYPNGLELLHRRHDELRRELDEIRLSRVLLTERTNRTRSKTPKSAPGRVRNLLRIAFGKAA